MWNIFKIAVIFLQNSKKILLSHIIHASKCMRIFLFLLQSHNIMRKRFKKLCECWGIIHMLLKYHLGNYILILPQIIPLNGHKITRIFVPYNSLSFWQMYVEKKMMLYIDKLFVYYGYMYLLLGEKNLWNPII